MSLPYIPYFQTTRYRIQTMIELADVKPGEKAADLGSGDGRIVVEFAKAGADTVGYELDESLIKLSKEHTKKFEVAHNTTILQKDFWQEDLSQYNIITVYPMPDIMEALEEKLFDELKPGARVLLNYYPFPNWQYEITKDHIYLYKR